MKNSIISGCRNLINETELTILKTQDISERSEFASQATERFLHAAAALPEGELIGWQIAADKDKDFRCFTFTSSGLNITLSDICWIFDHCGHAEPETSIIEDLFRDNRKVYMFSSVSGDSNDINSFARRVLKRSVSNSSMIKDLSDDDSSLYPVVTMLSMLAEEGAVIWIIAGSASEDSPGHGMILISLSGELSLKIRAQISIAFPHIMLEEIKETPHVDREIKCLPDQYLADGMISLLHVLMKQPKVIPEEDDFKEDDFKEDDYIDDDFEDDDLLDPVEEIREDTTADDGISSEKSADDTQDAARSMDMLEELVGLENVKERVRKIAAFAAMKKDMAEHHHNSLPMALNMDFKGNPGTAKTTVARILAGIFHEIGLLSSDELIEVGRVDLIGKYVGHTADKVQEVFQKAKGKLLFIDEAYSLVHDTKNGFGDEAISTIVQEMENRRDSTVVIFAGYPNEMEDLFASNPGLRSRVPFSISFQDYSPEELLQIADMEAKKRGFSIDEKAKEKVLTICQSAAGDPEAGNGRFCRNLVENAILEYADRVYKAADHTVDEDKNFVLKEGDFSVPDDREAKKKQHPIGFRT